MRNESKYLLLFVIILSIIGLIMIYSASSIWANYKYNDSFHFAKLQCIYLLISYISLFITSKIDFHIWKKNMFPVPHILATDASKQLLNNNTLLRHSYRLQSD